MSGTVSKHVALVSELSNIVSQRNLLEISELEQELACQDQHSVHLQKLKKILTSGKIRDVEACKLVMLYAIRYENHSNNALSGLMDILRQIGVSKSDVQLPLKILDYSNEHTKYTHNNDTAINPQDIIAKKALVFLKELKGVENVYTQHEPVLKHILDDLLKGKLKENLFPYLEFYNNKYFQDIIVFMIGGTTYEECLTVHQFNTNSNKVILGATTVHNSRTFMQQVSQHKI